MNPFQPGLVDRIPRLKRICIFKASRIGDFINCTPAIRAIRHAFPDADISLITLPILKDLVQRLDSINCYIEFPGYPGIAEQLFNPRKTTAFLKEMQSNDFDLAIQFQGSGVYSNPLLLMLGARYSAGFIRTGDPPGRLDAAIPWPETGPEIIRNLMLTRHLGIKDAGMTTDFPLLEEDVEQANKLLQNWPKPWIGLHVSARDSTRRWKIEKFALLARHFLETYGGTIITVGEPIDRNQIQDGFDKQGIRIVNLAGKTTLPVLGAVIDQFSLFITNDTGPAHIAYARSTPTVVIFGSGDPDRNGPTQRNGRSKVIAHPVDCRPCSFSHCPIGTACLQFVTVDEVFVAGSTLLQKNSRAT